MKASRFLWRAEAIFLLISLLCVSCQTTNSEVKKKQEEASRQLGEAYMTQKDYTSALKELLKAEALYSADPYLHNDLGLAYMAKEQFDLAIQHFKKAIKIKPDYAPARNNLGTAYLEKKDWDQAIKCFKELTGDLLYATPHFPLFNLGVAYYNKKAYLLAEKYYKEALEREPGFVLALRGLGKTYIATGKIPEAIAQFEAAVKHSPRSAQLYFDLAHAYSLYRDFPKARHAYEKVIELSPDSDLAAEAKSALDKMK